MNPTEKNRKANVAAAAAVGGASEAKEPSVNRTSGRIPFDQWDVLQTRLVQDLRRSEALTDADLAIRINAKD